MARGENTAGHPGRNVTRDRYGMLSPWGPDAGSVDLTPGEHAEVASIVGPPRERPIPNYDYNPQAEEDADAPSEPDYEGIMERRAERRRPDWAQ